MVSGLNIRFFSFTFALLFLLCVLRQEAGAQTDSLYLDLDAATHVGKRNTSSIQKIDGGSLRVNLDQIQNLPKILGNTDPLSFVRMLPGVQTGSEYDSGINIQGCDNAHNDFSISGVPVFGATHLFGLFSVFNPSHYRNMTFSPSALSAAGANRLGGVLRMELPDTLAGKVGGDLSVGIMSSQGTIGIRTGKKSYLHLSARHSYLNLLYKRWLIMDNDPIRYSFGDYNLTWYVAPTSDDRVWIDLYAGNDSASILANNYNVGLSADWGNLIGALHWEHKGKYCQLDQSVYMSGYRTKVLVEQSPASVEIPSGIGAAGYKAKVAWKEFMFGADVTGYKAMPQSPVHEGLYGESSASESQTGLEADIWADYTYHFPHDISLTAGLKASAFLSPEKEFSWGLSPLVVLAWNGYNYGSVNLSYGIQRQYVFQTGLSNIGIPMDFWFLAGKHSAPQMAHSASLGYKVEVLGGEVALSADLYYKRLHNQVEYKGDLFDLFTSVYSLDNHLLKGKGHNYGVNLMLHKQSGKFTGWISYSIGRALRSFGHPDYPGIYPANHERIHDLSAVASYDLGKWNFSGNFVLATGRPFTPPEAFYITSGSIITKYGDHNSCRLRSYIRLDISVNRSFIKNDRMENGVNLSVYNVLARKNEVMWRLNVVDERYAYRPISFFLQVMPSVSYYHKF